MKKVFYTLISIVYVLHGAFASEDSAQFFRETVASRTVHLVDASWERVFVMGNQCVKMGLEIYSQELSREIPGSFSDLCVENVRLECLKELGKEKMDDEIINQITTKKIKIQCKGQVKNIGSLDFNFETLASVTQYGLKQPSWNQFAEYIKDFIEKSTIKTTEKWRGRKQNSQHPRKKQKRSPGPGAAQTYADGTKS